MARSGCRISVWKGGFGPKAGAEFAVIQYPTSRLCPETTKRVKWRAQSNNRAGVILQSKAGTNLPERRKISRLCAGTDDTLCAAMPIRGSVS
jgi:hypothetical protein